MTEPIAYLNGEWIPFTAARLSVADFGVVQAATVTEMIRTFRHRPFRMTEHLERLRGSLVATGIGDPALIDSLPPIIERVVRENARLIAPGDDLGISVFITAGISPVYANGSSLPVDAPTVCVHTFLLPLERWCEQYEHGMTLLTPSVRAISPVTINPRIKYRSRLHWYLAEREVHQIDPDAVPLLLDMEGHLTETSSSNVILYDGDVLQIPRTECVLGGVSLQVALELGRSLGIEHRTQNLIPADLWAAQEVFVSSTPYCLLPVTRHDDQVIGSGKPGPLYRQLIDRWSQMVEVDIIGQSREQSNERAT